MQELYLKNPIFAAWYICFLRTANDSIKHMKSKSRKMVHYDKEADVLALYLERGRAEEIAEIIPGVSVEFSKNGSVMGFEILNASKVLKSFLASHVKRSVAHARA
jgi:uncharacterized protein YuzE